MFDIGFTELLIVALVGLIVLGPKRLPEVARTAGRWLGRLRRFMSDVKQDFDRELQDADLAELRNLKQELDETRRSFEETSGQLMQQVSAVQDEAGAAQPSATAPAKAPDRGEQAKAGTGKRTGARRRKPAAKRAHEPSE